MISEQKKIFNNEKKSKKNIFPFKSTTKTIVKMYKDNKVLTLIQYNQNTSRCFQIIENQYLHFGKKINLKLLNKTFKIKKGVLLQIKKITPEILLDFLKLEDLKYLKEDIDEFTGTLDSYPYDDINFYINKCLQFFKEILSYDYFCDISIKLAQANFINYLNKLKHFFQKFDKHHLHSLFSDIFQSYMDNLNYLQKAFYDIATNPISSESSIITLNLPKQIVSVRKNNISTKKNKYYSKLDATVSIFCINTLNELIDTIIYFIIYNRIFIKQCEHCKQLFIPTRIDTCFCKNPSPEKPSKTCQKLRTHFNKKQTEQDKKIQYLYAKFSTIYTNNKKKHPEYEQIWNIFKHIYSENRENIFHLRYKRSDMIKWLNKIIENPKLLLEEHKTENNLLITFEEFMK